MSNYSPRISIKSETATALAINQSTRKNKESISLIWFDSSIDTTDDSKTILDILRTANDFLVCFTECSPCAQYIKSIEKEKIFLIISGRNAYELLPEIITCAQVDTVFIFCADRKEYQRVLEDFPKVADIVDNCNDLLTAIQRNIKLVDKQTAIFSLYDQHQQATRDLSKELAEFLWFRMFKDVIENLPRDDQAKAQMIEACRRYYRGNHKVLVFIDEFEKTYHSDDCIRWYTKETFLYKLINKALRTEDIKQLYTFRFYIADLSAQLALEYEKIKQGTERQVRLYRGAKVSKDEIERLQRNEGYLVATNGYLSTSRSREYALTFANKILGTTNSVNVLYEIECDLDQLNGSVVFADICHFSDLPAELEVLFDLGCTFKIRKVLEVDEGDGRFWIVQMIATSEGQEIANEFIKQNRKEMEFESVTILFSTLLRRMGDSTKSFDYLQQLLKTPGDENVAHIHNRLGAAFKDKRDYDQAIRHFDIAYELTVKSSNEPDQIYSITVLLNKGVVYARRHEYPEALKIFEDALNQLIEKRGPIHCDVAKFKTWIGRVYLHMHVMETALQYQKEALSIREQCLPPNHPTLAFSLTDIATVHWKEGSLEIALEYHLKALELRRKVLPADHHNTAWSLHMIGQLYLERKELDIALDYLQESLRMFEKLELSWNFKTRQVLNHIAIIFDAQGKLQDALDYRLQLASNLQNMVPINNRFLLHSLDTIIHTLEKLGDLKRALSYRLEVWNLLKKLPYVDYWTCTQTLNDIAHDYEYIDESELALGCFYKVSENYKYLIPSQHQFRREVAENIRRLEVKLRHI